MIQPVMNVRLFQMELVVHHQHLRVSLRLLKSVQVCILATLLTVLLVKMSARMLTVDQIIIGVLVHHIWTLLQHQGVVQIYQRVEHVFSLSTSAAAVLIIPHLVKFATKRI